MKIKLSVIVPVYNVKKYLSTCIESILNQTYADFEVVLVDDGSTDGCSEVCDEYKYKDARVRVIHQENKGLLYARYVGICMAKGEYATFVDSDDWLDLHTYEIAMKNISSEIDMISFGMIRYYTSERMFKDANKIKAGEYFREDIEEKVIPKMFWDEDLHTCGLDPSLCNKIVKRSLWLKQFEKAKELGVYFGEDAAIAYPMVMEMQHLIIVDECLYYHRLRPESEMPSYLLDEMFYDKLYTWYVYLRECLRENASLLRQLECYYYHAMGKRVCSNKKSIAKGQNYPYTMLFTILYLFVLLSNKPTAIPYLPHFNRIAFVNSIILPKHKSTNFQKYSLSKNFTITFIFTNFIFSKHRNNLHKFQEYL